MRFTSYLIVFIGIYLIYLIFVILRKKALKKFRKSAYVVYLEKVYKIDVDKINPYILSNMVCIVNAFVIATTLYVFSNLKGALSYLVGFATLFGLIFLMYHILGLILKKKGDKNV